MSNLYRTDCNIFCFAFFLLKELMLLTSHISYVVSKVISSSSSMKMVLEQVKKLPLFTLFSMSHQPLKDGVSLVFCNFWFYTHVPSEIFFFKKVLLEWLVVSHLGISYSFFTIESLLLLILHTNF